jgi:MGT family glycosyltransferase
MKNSFQAETISIGSYVKPGGRILFANVPADGHFNPLTGLAVHLKEIGYDVRWYSARSYEEKINRLNIPFYPFEKALEINGENLPDLFPERAEIKGQVPRLRFDMINVFILRSTEYYEDIKAINHSWPFDMMIADVAFSAIPLVKETMGKPVISIGVFPLTETSKDLPPVGLGMVPSTSFLGRVKQRFLRYFADKVLFSGPTKVMKDILSDYGIETGSSNVFDLLVKKSTLVLQSGTPGFEYKRSDLGKNVRFIGPVIPYKHTKKREQWYSEKLETYEKVILVTQGTVEKDPEKIIIPTLNAFKNSKNILVIATTGGSMTQELRERFSFHNVIIEDFIPFDDVMPHADLYITNGGYGGVMLAIEHKLPLVVAGVHEGKNEINARVGYFKLGINLGTERPKPEQIRKAVTEVIANDQYRKNVENLGEEFSHYNPKLLTAFYVKDLIVKAPVKRGHTEAVPRMKKQSVTVAE